jgi:hypothetical protein
LIDALKAHQDDYTMMRKLKKSNMFLSASKDKSFKVWSIPSSWERGEDFYQDGNGDDLEGTEYFYTNVEMLHKESKSDGEEDEVQVNHRKNSRGQSDSNSSESSDSEKSSDSEVDYRGQRGVIPKNVLATDARR